MKCVYLALLSVLCVLLACTPSGAAGIPPRQCRVANLEEVPPSVRRFCTALSTLYEMSNAMEVYMDDKGDQELERLMQICSAVMCDPENAPLPDSGMKRHDVDHVFLRFGRRR